MEQIKGYIIAGLLLALAAGIWAYGHSQYLDGRDEVQRAWDADKAKRKAEADVQAAGTAKTNQENKDALDKTKADLRNAHRDLAAALERLRNTGNLPWQGSMPMAGSGQTTVPGMAHHTGGTGIGISQRIGSCTGSGSDPCLVSRGFFEQALSDATDRGLTRTWAAGQRIKTVGGDK